ncbi:MAG: hypothetical protein SFV54_27970 [Bryobacteraceae bacterium]|nr:hypothetical protein [Bryobacteraceae bacterium]
MPLLCRIDAIPQSRQARYRELAARVKAAVRAPVETRDGFRFELDPASISLAEIGEWMSLESLCCPFLRFELRLAPGAAAPSLALAGAEEESDAGVKEILAAAFLR